MQHSISAVLGQQAWLDYMADEEESKIWQSTCNILSYCHHWHHSWPRNQGYLQ